MNSEDFKFLKYFGILSLNYKDRIIFTEEVLKNTQFKIVKLMDNIQDMIQDSYRIKVHCFFEAPGGVHVSKSRHYIGAACDFHLERLNDNNNKFLYQVDVIEESLKELKVFDKSGLGIYPQWYHPGFHLDFPSETKRRWGQLDGNYVSWNDAMEWVKKNV